MGAVFKTPVAAVHAACPHACSGQHTQSSLPSHLLRVGACQPHVGLDDLDAHRFGAEHCQAHAHAWTVVPPVLAVAVQAAGRTVLRIGGGGGVHNQT